MGSDDSKNDAESESRNPEERQIKPIRKSLEIKPKYNFLSHILGNLASILERWIDRIIKSEAFAQ